MVPAMWETQVRSLDREDALEQKMATHSSTFAWKIPWTVGYVTLVGYGPWGRKGLSSRETSISALLTMPKPLTVWITINCGKF